MHQDQLTGLNNSTIFSYNSFRKFLLDYYTTRKSADPKFSFEIWSSELGYKSRSYIRMVTQGKRKTNLDFVEKMSRALHMNEKEKTHLAFLALYESGTAAEKKYYLDKILESFSDLNAVSEIKNYSDFLLTKELPLILVLASCDDFKCTLSHLSQMLQLSPSTLQQHLEKLESMQLIRSLSVESSAEKIWISENRNLKIPDRFHDQTLTAFHQATMKEAHQVIESLATEQRFRSIYVPISAEQFPEFKEDMELFLNKMKQKYADKKIKNKSVFKLNLNTYAVTAKNK